jgi:hypothetical protein
MEVLAVTNYTNEFETWKLELQEQLSVIEVIEPHLPKTYAEIRMARYAVDEFCHLDPPATDDALTRVEQMRAVVLMSLKSIWRSCFRAGLVLR